MEAGALRAPASINRISITAPLLRLRSDEQLVAAFRAGNDAAFTVIHDRYRQRLFAYTRQMLGGSRQDAEDALQDVFLRAYASLRTDDRPLSLRAWLYRVAHNRCIDHLRRPVPPPIDVFDSSRKPLHDPIAEAERREDLRRLIADVRRLPEQQRSALLMREIDGMSYAELAAALDVSLPAVKSLLVRARIGLVEAVEARDTACSVIRGDLAEAFDRGVRASGRARRHMRDCMGCAEYRTGLRSVRAGLNALSPGPGALGALAKLVGIGGAGSAGAASAGGGAVAGTSAVAVAGGGTAAKVAAVVCCAALTAGGAAEVTERIVHPPSSRPAAPAASSASPAAALPVGRSAPAAGGTAAIRRSGAAPVRSSGFTGHAAAGGGVAAPLTSGAAAPLAETGTGGSAAPVETASSGAGAPSASAPATASSPATAAAPGAAAGVNGAGGSHAPADGGSNAEAAATLADDESATVVVAGGGGASAP